MPRKARQAVSDADMRAILKEMRLLLDKLDHPEGTLLDPGAVAEQLRAVREERIEVIPIKQPPVMLTPHADWSDLNKVPIEALGLRMNAYRDLVDAKIETVGLLIKHSRRGLRSSGVTMGNMRVSNVVHLLTERGLSFAETNARLPIDFVIANGYQGGVFRYWNEQAQRAFVHALNVSVLGDLSNLLVAQIASAPFGDYEDVGPKRPMSSESPHDLELVVRGINDLLHRYGLPEIHYSSE